MAHPTAETIIPDQTPAGLPPIVAIAVSHADLEAARILLAGVREDLGFAYLLLFDEGPPIPNWREDLVNNKGVHLPVTDAKDGLLLKPNEVYLIPVEAGLALNNGRFSCCTRARSKGDKGALLLALRSLTDAEASQALAVVLSGPRSVDVTALKTFKQANGMVLVQDPATARFDEMPRSVVAQGLADTVLLLPELAEELSRVCRQRLAAASEDSRSIARHDLAFDDDDASIEDSLQQILALVKRSARVDLSQYKLTTVRRRVQRQMALSKIESFEEYAHFLRTRPDAVQALHDDVFIHVTEFFRDPTCFEALRDQVFPDLIKGRDESDPIRIWVPGCSTGEEAYSLGICLMEFLEDHNLGTAVQIFATDISERTVQRARKAVYHEDLLRNVSQHRIDRFFDKVAEGYKIKKSLRELCVISRHDVTANPPFARLDLVSCRNVLIYFEQTLQKKIIPVFHYALKPGGYLLLGQSESPGSFLKLFATVDKKNKIYSKLRNTPSSQLHIDTRLFNTEKLSIVRSVRSERNYEHDLQKSADQILLYKYAPAGVIVSWDLEILQFRGRTAPFLEPPPGQPSVNLLKMAHPALLPSLRILVQTAKKQNVAARKEDISVEWDMPVERVNLEVTPLNPGSPEKDRQYLILFEDGSEARRASRGTYSPKTIKGLGVKNKAGVATKDRLIEQLQQELDALRDHQQLLNDQFETTQEELTSANEELQATNEELQSTNEELETAKEELQSANEELTTLNDELQSRNAELVTLNEKLTTSEERFRLMIETVRDYAIFMLDPQGRVASWNEGARRFKGYEGPEVIGKHFSVFYPVEEILKGKPHWELEQARIEGRLEDEGWRLRKDGTTFWANVVITRVNNASGELIGYSKVTQDLTERRLAEEILRKSEERFRMMVDAVKDYAIFMLDTDGCVISWNNGAKRIKGYEASDIIGSHFSRFYTQTDLDRNHPAEELKIATATGKYEEEGWRVRSDGSTFWANVVINRIDGPNGEHIGFSKVTRDLTERKIAEEKVLRASAELERRVEDRTRELNLALRAKDEFLSIASHELKTPLTSLKLQLQMTRRDIDPERGIQPATEELVEALDLTVKQAEALSSLVEDLLDLSRTQTGRLRLVVAEVDLSNLVGDVVARFASQLAAAGCTIKVKTTPGIVGRWDRHRLEQVITNLLSNAIKYAAKSPVIVSTFLAGEKACVVVEDFGAGIAKTDQGRIFERFERAHPDPYIGGLGLGLFITRRLIEAHDGRIEVESEIGKGAKFIVQLPLQTDLDATFDV